MQHLRSVFIIIFLSLLIGLQSCSPERTIARKYAINPKDKAVLVLLPSQVWLVNQKSDYPSGSFTFLQAEQDHRLLENTFLLPKMSRESVIGTFSNSYVSELKKYGIKVYTEDQTEAFMKHDSLAYILNLAQIELQEYFSPVEDEVRVSETLYTYDFTVNGLNLGLWLEFNKLNDNNIKKPTVLFATHDLLDRYEGYFSMKFMTGKINYNLKVDTLTIERAMNFISYLGRLYAAYTFDYMMNDYVDRKLGPALVQRKYFRWDPFNRRLKATINDRFIILDD